jgi:transcriptional regulator with XRE-family HTH domain
MLISGLEIKESRIAAGLTQAEVADQTGLSIRTIADIENLNDTFKSPSIRNVEKVLKAVGMEMIIRKSEPPTLDDLLASRSAQYAEPALVRTHRQPKGM